MHIAHLTLAAVGIAAQIALVVWLAICAVCLVAHVWILCGGTLSARLTRIERNLEAFALEPWQTGKRLWFHGKSLFNSVFAK